MPILSSALISATLMMQQLPAVSIAPVPGKGYAATVPIFPRDQLDAVISRVEVLAQQKCGKLEARFGRFYFENPVQGGKAMVDNYRQSFKCIDPANDPYPRAPASWQPSDVDTQQATSFVYRYLSAIDKGLGTAGAAMMEPEVEVTPADWLATTDILRAGRTGPGSWTAMPIGWANNPPGAAHPGSYALYDVTGSYPGIAKACGTILIYRAGPNKYLVTQQNLKVVTEAQRRAGAITAANLATLCDTM